MPMNFGRYWKAYQSDKYGPGYTPPFSQAKKPDENAPQPPLSNGRRGLRRPTRRGGLEYPLRKNSERGVWVEPSSGKLSRTREDGYIWIDEDPALVRGWYRDPWTLVRNRSGKWTPKDIENSVHVATSGRMGRSGSGWQDLYLAARDAQVEQDFDVSDWALAGGNIVDLLREAGASNLASLAASRPNAPMAAIRQGLRHGSFNADFERLVHFYEEQFKSYREEGSDRQESFRSLIRRTPLGPLIEEGLGRQAEFHRQMGATYEGHARSLREQLLMLEGQRKRREISDAEYFDARRIARENQSRLARDARRHQRRASAMNSALEDFIGERPETRYLANADIGLESWDRILQQRHGLTSRDIASLHDLLPSNHLTGGWQNGLSPEDRDLLAERIDYIKPGLSSKILGMSSQEIIELRQRTGAEEIHKLYALRGIGGMPEGEVAGAPLLMSKGRLFGMEAHIQEMVDRNQWEFRNGRWEAASPVESAGLGRPAFRMRPVDMLPENMLKTLRSTPVAGSVLGEEAMLRGYRNHPLIRSQVAANGSSPIEEASDQVYADISRRIRRLVSGTTQDMPLPTEGASGDVATILNKISPRATIDPNELVSELIAYPHIHYGFDNAHIQAFKSILTNEGHDPYLEAVADRLRAIVPDINSIIYHRGEGDTQVNVKRLMSLMKPVFNEAAIPTSRAAVKARIFDQRSDLAASRKADRLLSDTLMERLAGPANVDKSKGLDHIAAQRLAAMDNRVISDALAAHSLRKEMAAIPYIPDLSIPQQEEQAKRIAKIEKRIESLQKAWMREGSLAPEYVEAEKATAFYRAIDMLRSGHRLQAEKIIRQQGLDPNEILRAMTTRMPLGRIKAQAAEAYRRRMDTLQPNRIQRSYDAIEDQVGAVRSMLGQLRNPNTISNVQREFRKAIHTYYPRYASVIEESIAGLDSGAPDFGASLADIAQKKRAFEGYLHSFDNGEVNSYYHQLGGEREAPMLRLHQVDHITTEQAFALQRSRHSLDRLAEEYHLPEEFSTEEKARIYAAFHMPSWMEEWANTEGMQHLTDLEGGQLSPLAVDEALRRARAQLAPVNWDYRYRVESEFESLDERGQISEAEASNLINKFQSAIYKDAKVAGEEVGDMKAYFRAEGMVRTLQEIAAGNLGGRLRRVSNSGASEHIVLPTDIRPQQYGRNTVTIDRANANQSILSHYFGWFREGNKQLKGALITDSQNLPRINGSLLSPRDNIMGEAISQLNEALAPQGLDFDMLRSLSEEFGVHPKSVARGTGSLAEKAREAMGYSGEYYQSSFYSPLAMGGWVDVGGERPKRLGEVWGRYLSAISSGPEDLTDMARLYNINTEGITNREELAQKIFEASGGRYDFRAASLRDYLAKYFTDQAKMLQDKNVQGLFSANQQEQFNRIFMRGRSSEGHTTPTAAEMGRTAEDAFRSSTKRKYRRITGDDVRAMMKSKKGRIGMAAAGIFTAWGIARSVRDDHDEKDIQGPPHMPGGNPYQGTAYPEPVYTSSGFPQEGGNGVTYRVRAHGNYNPDDMQANVMRITNGSIQSGSVYDTPSRPDPDKDVDSAMGNYQ